MTTDNTVTDDLVESARSMRRSAVEQLLRAHHPRVCRIAYSLCGRENRGRQVVKTVMKKSLTALPKWNSAQDASNWFLHHTLLATRDLAGTPPESADDCMVNRIDRPTAEYVSFVRALRHLPRQQQEALLLVRCERLEPRQMAVAMDCSTAAAANHLLAANRTLSEIAATGFDACIATLLRVYASFTPPENLIVGDISALGRKLSRRRIRRAIMFLLALAVIGLTAWAVWRLSQMVVI